jgi:hypothetical protein
MGKLSPLWEFFTKLKKPYQNNKSHAAARCNACLNYTKLQLERDDLDKVTLGGSRRSETELHAAGMFEF